MRAYWIALPLIIAATPAVAAPAVPQLPPELSDPAMADKLGRMAGVLTKSLMDLPVGELEAAVQGRPATAADKAKRVRDSIGGPEAEQRVQAEVAQSGRQMQAMSKALVASLPAIMAALDQAEKQLERATANLPDPTYPKR
ncbi:hypothetical protein LVY65_11975 [Sphingomonas sp. G124]|jgi:hypothetical protein|uniref:Uncharacterized protein n=1 Tax=Sphingomonas cremea TaxID=2904799 RepID=A0A9X1QNJ8_9SPHN|nr:hypothetical protein [Sphingomonas cremea]MCF2515774.1 hypothetical protein [Sphingomonas cremea]